MAEDERKAALAEELSRARSRITADLRTVRHDLDIPARLRRSFVRHPAIWIGAAAILGLFASRALGRKNTPPPARKRREREPELEKAGKAGLVLGALKIAFDIARPFLMTWAKQQFADRFGGERRGGFADR